MLFPDRQPDEGDYIQSVFFDKKTGEEVGEPIIPYMTNIIGEGEIMTAVSLGSYVLPDDFAKRGALGDIIRYNKSTYFLNNNFHVQYRNLARKGAPSHVVPFQLMQDKGFYKNINHYFLHIPDVDNLDDCEVVVFCHGYSGNWVMYPQLFAHYTDAVVIAVETQSFVGYFSKSTMRNIVNNVIPHAYNRAGINPKKKAHLIGLSNGGSAVNTAITFYPNTFKSYTILSASLRSTPKPGMNVHIIYGAQDASGGVSPKIPKSRYVRHRIKNNDHSLLVSDSELTFKLINEIIGGGKK